MTLELLCISILVNQAKILTLNKIKWKLSLIQIAILRELRSKHLTRIEVKLSDEDGDKKSENDKRCVLEARLKGMQPLVVTGLGHSVDNAVDAAIGKMRSSLDSMKGRLKDF